MSETSGSTSPLIPGAEISVQFVHDFIRDTEGNLTSLFARRIEQENTAKDRLDLTVGPTSTQLKHGVMDEHGNLIFHQAEIDQEDNSMTFSKWIDFENKKREGLEAKWFTFLTDSMSGRAYYAPFHWGQPLKEEALEFSNLVEVTEHVLYDLSSAIDLRQRKARQRTLKPHTVGAKVIKILSYGHLLSGETSAPDTIMNEW